MAGKQFSVSEVVRLGFRLTFRHFGFVLLAALSYFFLMNFVGIVTSFFSQYLGHVIRPDVLSFPTIKSVLGLVKSPLEIMTASLAQIKAFGALKFLWAPLLISFLLSLVSLVFQSSFFLGLMRIGFDLYDNGQSKLGRFFSCFGLIGKYIVACVILIALIFSIVVVSALVAAPLLFVSKDLAFFVWGVLTICMICWLGVRMFFLVFFIVDKDFSGYAAIKESFRMTRGHTWKLIGTSLLSILMGITIIGIPAVYFMLVSIYRKIS